jgi:hypothetical protein
MIRPWDLIEGVIKDTGLPKRKHAGIFFGNALWDYNDIPVTQWEKAQPKVKARIQALYHAGTIRYGSW